MFGIREAVAAALALACLPVASLHAASPVDRAESVPAAIHQVQGDGLVSELAGTQVEVEGIVTARIADGFFVQTPLGLDDGDPATSEGLFVFTGTTPGSDATVGNRVRTTGLVEEFMSAGNPHQLTVTRLVMSTLASLDSGNLLPDPVPLQESDLTATSDLDAMERFEGMRVAAQLLQVVGPSQGLLDETNLTTSNTGVMHVVIGNNPAPRREPGISMLEAIVFPAGKSIPLFDANPEVLRLDSGAQPGANRIDLGARTGLRLMRGVLHYADGLYTLLPDPGGTMPFFNPSTALAAGRAADREIAVGWMDLGRFFDDNDDPSREEPIPTAAGYERRVIKLARAVCEAVSGPDIIAVTGVEGTGALDDLAAALNEYFFCGATSYSPHLVEGNDPSGLDVGFLVKTGDVSAGTPRVTVLEVTQIGAAATLQGPAPTGRALFGQPPLFLRARVSDAQGNQAELSVLAVQLRDEAGLSSLLPGVDGWATESEAVMAQRAQQASHVADWIQARQDAFPSEALLVLGGFEANQFSDGRVDVMGILTGVVPPPETVWLAVDSPVTPALALLPPIYGETERTTAIIRGSRQALDHALASTALLERYPVRMQPTRFNSGRPVSDANELVSGVGFSRRDPFVVNIAVPAFSDADVALGLYTPAMQNPELEAFANLQIRNDGPEAAHDLQLEFTTTLPADAYSLDTAGWPWTCSAPTPTPEGSRIDCTTVELGVRSFHEFRIAIAPDASRDETTADFSARIAGGYRDPVPGNDAATRSTLFRSSTDIGTTIPAVTEKPLPGTEGYFGVTLSNPSGNAPGPVTLVAVVDAARSAVSTSVGSGEMVCDAGVDLGPRESRFTCTIAAPVGEQFGNVGFLVRNALGDGGREVGLQVTATSSRNDSNPADNTASASYVVGDDVDFMVRSWGASPEPGNLDTDLIFRFYYEHRVPGVARNARAEFSIEAPPEAVVAQALTTPPDWSCSAAVADGPGRSRLECSAPALLERNNLTSAGSFGIVLRPPLVAGLAHRTLGVTMTLSSDSDELTPADNQVSELATVVQTTDQRLVIVAQQGQVVEPGTATYRMTVSNSGHNAAVAPRLRLDFNAVLPPADISVGMDGSVVPVACTTTPADPGHTALSCVAPNSGGLLVGVRTSPAMADRDLVVTGRLENLLVEVTPADNIDSESTAVVAVTDLCTATPTQSCGGLPVYSPGRIVAGQVRQVSHVVRNLGPSTAIAPQVTLTAGLPAAQFSARIDGAECAVAVATGPGTSRVLCTPGTLAGDGQPHTIDMRMDASGIDGGAVVAYQIALSSESADPVTSNNVASYTATVVPVVDLSVAIESKAAAGSANLDVVVLAGAQGPATTATSRLSVALSVPGAEAHATLAGDGWQCSRTGSPTSARYDCSRGTAITPGTRARLVLSLPRNFAQSGQAVGVEAVHDYAATAAAEDITPGNNAATRSIATGGRSTNSHRKHPAPRTPTPAPRARSAHTPVR